MKRRSNPSIVSCSEKGLNLLTMWDSWSTSNFSFAAALLMIVVDIVWMSVAIWVIEEVKEGGERFINLFYTGKVRDFAYF